MTNTPESDTMKTLTELEKTRARFEKLVLIIDEKADLIKYTSPKFIGQYADGCLQKAWLEYQEQEAQLLATFNAWIAQKGWKLVPIEPTKEMLECIGWDNMQDWEKGKQLQREKGLSVVPPNYEYEAAVGQYERLLAASPLKG